MGWKYYSGTWNPPTTSGTWQINGDDGIVTCPSHGLVVVGRVSMRCSGSYAHSRDGWSMNVRRKRLDGTLDGWQTVNNTYEGGSTYFSNMSFNNTVGTLSGGMAHPDFRDPSHYQGHDVLYPGEKLGATNYMTSAGTTNWFNKLGYEYWVWEAI